ncbi:DNA-binding response OmpR family regulator [Nonomuraea soli]|uniref:DNA-binding response OmpR family regulator n=2 Tax=Nonomuraea soli TaxID=1032476 RepID=A0A7W0HN67_9ACTN|nr:DNA-binding response OmpR family regulator [Nonomuraea soli]
MSTTADDTMKVLVYSDDANTREKVRLAIGRRPAADLPLVEIVECATEPKVHQWLASGEIDVAVLDGETQPAGGMGVCRQAKDEVYDCPPVLLLIARRDDRWLADWSKADAVVAQPLEPVAVADAVAELMRKRTATRLTA